MANVRISDQLLNEIHEAENALLSAKSGDAEAAVNIAAVHTAEKLASDSITNALNLHVTANNLARQALLDLRNLLEFDGDDRPVVDPLPPPQQATPNASKRPQHPAITQALNLGIDWGTILQALLKGGMTALLQLIQQVIAGNQSKN